MRRHLTPNDEAPSASLWRPMPSYPDYEVSEWGQVRRIAATSPHAKIGQIRFWKTNTNCWQTQLQAPDGERKAWSAHRIVCSAFHGPPPFPGAHACHGDDVRENNHFTNLRWATAKENIKDRTRNGGTRRGAQNGFAKLSERSAREILRASGTFTSIGAKYGVSRVIVARIKSGKAWRHIQE
jgi:hypothetical protein